MEKRKAGSDGLIKAKLLAVVAGILMLSIFADWGNRVHASDENIETWTENFTGPIFTRVYAKNIGSHNIHVDGITISDCKNIRFGDCGRHYSTTGYICPQGKALSVYDVHPEDKAKGYNFNFTVHYTIRKDMDDICGNIPAKKKEGKQSGQEGKATISSTGQRFVYNGNGTVTDRRTSLMWLKDANPCGAKDWDSAKSYCENLSYGGYSDWRLPTKAELQGIGTDPPTTWERATPSVTWTKPGAPFSNVQSHYYWSGTIYATNPDGAWGVSMGNGGTDYGSKSYSINFVWPVRGDN